MKKAFVGGQPDLLLSLRSATCGPGITGPTSQGCHEILFEMLIKHLASRAWCVMGAQIILVLCLLIVLNMVIFCKLRWPSW